MNINTQPKDYWLTRHLLYATVVVSSSGSNAVYFFMPYVCDWWVIKCVIYGFAEPIFYFFALQIQIAGSSVKMTRCIFQAGCGRAACKHLFQEVEAELPGRLQFITSCFSFQSAWGATQPRFTSEPTGPRGKSEPSVNSSGLPFCDLHLQDLHLVDLHNHKWKLRRAENKPGGSVAATRMKARVKNEARAPPGWVSWMKRNNVTLFFLDNLNKYTNPRGWCL